jgi:hypothetical protein
MVAAAVMVSTSEVSAQGRGRNSVPRSFEVVPISITGVAIDPANPNRLLVSGISGTTAFTEELLVSVTPAAVAGQCPILNLSLGPIDLNLLGLVVETSPICLDVTAIRGGGLLGDLLCGVAELLSTGVPIGTAIGGLQADQQAQVLNGLASLLDQALDRVFSNAANLAATCDILNLSVGPLDLNLLGLRVELDNCANGPVTVDIRAVQGGGLLGDLLCGLSNRLSGGAGGNLSTAVQRLLFQISQLLGALA